MLNPSYILNLFISAPLSALLFLIVFIKFKAYLMPLNWLRLYLELTSYYSYIKLINIFVNFFLFLNCLLSLSMIFSNIIELIRCKLYLKVYDSPKKRIIWQNNLIFILRFFVHSDLAVTIVKTIIPQLNKIFYFNAQIYKQLPGRGFQTTSFIAALIYIFPEVRLLAAIIMFSIIDFFK